MTLDPGQWAIAILAAILVGVAKTGIGGLGLLAVVMFVQIMPAKEATGMILPLLCAGDIFAVLLYRQHARWSYLWRLFPWTAAGVLIGYVTLGRISEYQARLLIGGIVLTLVGLHLLRRHTAGHEAEHGAWFPPTIGILAGFTTLVANAAGPLMVIYLLAMRLPKMDFVGTGAVFFLLLNFFKVPFMVDLGLINAASFTINVMLIPAVVLGGWLGRKLLLRINQRVFENAALGLALLAGLKLLF